MEGFAHPARSAPIPNADDFFRIPLHVKPFRLIANCKDNTRILIGPFTGKAEAHYSQH
jgi:hypothetical protein